MAEENDKQQVGPAEPEAQPAESRQEPPAGAQPPAGPPPAAAPAPASGGAWRGRARGWAGRKPVQLLAAGVAGAIIGGGVVALLDVLDDGGEERTMLVRVERPGMGPYGPGWRRWDGPEWDGRGGFPPGWSERRFAPFPEPPRMRPDEPQEPVPSASPRA